MRGFGRVGVVDENPKMTHFVQHRVFDFFQRVIVVFRTRYDIPIFNCAIGMFNPQSTTISQDFGRLRDFEFRCREGALEVFLIEAVE